MVEWIKEHKGIFIAIVAVVVAIAVAICGVVILKGKNANKPNEPAGNTVNNETLDSTNENSDTQSQIEPSESQSVSESTPDGTSAAKTETQTKATESSATSTTKKQESIPTGVESLTDGNKAVYYPAEIKAVNKKYPVIVWANGTGMPTSGYDALLKKLAEGGYIVVADASVMTADGTAQSDSIDYIIGKNTDSKSIFCGKVDTAKIGATGHSQGGRSSVNAAQNDSRIKCIVSIAGASSAEEANGLTTPALFLTGTADMIVVSSQWCKPSYNAVAGRAAYASLKGGVHTTCMSNPEKVSGYVISWFDAYLKNDSTAKAVFQNGGQLSKDSAWQDFANKN